MATNDGYSPYPIGLTASETVEAIKRAHNIDNDLAGYVGYSESASTPSITNVKSGDLWRNTNTNKLFRAYVESDVLVWLEE